MAELALDHVQGNSLASHLDGMCVAQLMRSEAPANAGLERETPELRLLPAQTKVALASDR